MLNTLSLILPLALASLAFGQNTPPVVTNVAAAQQGECGELAIAYDLDDADGDACTVWLAMSEDGGASFSVPLLTMSGDFGEGILPGIDKMVIWDVVQDAPGVEGSDFVVRVYADDGNGSGPMVFVPPGTFQMGQTNTAEPIHPVTLSEYWIDKLETSTLQYAEFLNAGGNDDHWALGSGIIRTPDGQGTYIYSVIEGKAQHPIRRANYDDATAFCEWRGLVEGVTLTLPTEAQWENAAAWDPVLQQHWTYAFQSNSLPQRSANWAGSADPWENFGLATTPVGFYDGTVHQKADWDWPGSQSSYATDDAKTFHGARDMTGNVAEWCFDWYSSSYYQSYVNQGSPPDPTGPISGTQRVVRGGGWSGGDVSTERRSFASPVSRVDTIGFRCVRLAP